MAITLLATLLVQFGVSVYVLARPGRRLVFISLTECNKSCRFYVCCDCLYVLADFVYVYHYLS